MQLAQEGDRNVAWTLEAAVVPAAPREESEANSIVCLIWPARVAVTVFV